MRKLSEEHPPGALGGSQVTVMTTKKSWSLFNFIVPILFGEMMFLELFCDVLHNDLSALYRGYVYKHIEMSDAEKRAYGWLSFMASTSGCQIEALCAESFCERVLWEANDVCHWGNMLLDTEEINMLVVLRMNREFIQHMRKIYPKLSGQKVNGILVQVVI